MKALPPFVKMPSQWIEQRGLRKFRWKTGKSDEIAALMLYVVIAHHIDRDVGRVSLTYDQLGYLARLSRAKIAGGLELLAQRRLIVRNTHGRSSIALSGYDPRQGWAKLPARALYRGKGVVAFENFTLRKRAELDALKLYLLFAARRNRTLNMAPISYEKIEHYTGVKQERIKTALNILAANALVHTERFSSNRFEGGIAHAYRLTHLDSYRHLGTIGRDDDFDLTLALESVSY